MEIVNELWNPVVGVFLTILAGLFTAVPGVLALMKDTPESRRLRRWIHIGLNTVVMSAPGFILLAGYSLVALIAAVLAVVYCIAMISRGNWRLPESILMLVLATFSCSSILSMHLTDMIINLAEEQVKALKSLDSETRELRWRLDNMESVLREIERERAGIPSPHR